MNLDNQGICIEFDDYYPSKGTIRVGGSMKIQIAFTIDDGTLCLPAAVTISQDIREHIVGSCYPHARLDRIRAAIAEAITNLSESSAGWDALAVCDQLKYYRNNVLSVASELEEAAQ